MTRNLRQFVINVNYYLLNTNTGKSSLVKAAWRVTWNIS